MSSVTFAFFRIPAVSIIKKSNPKADTTALETKIDQLVYQLYGLTEEEIKRMKADAEANAEADKKAKETAEKLNAADAMIFQTESQLQEFGDKLSADKKQPIEDALEELKKAYETKDIAVIDPALDKINEAWKVASEEMYKAQAEAQGGAQPEPDASKNGQSETSDVEDVDFEEVK